ncbi:venom dipeptidyl peptidase 4-like [Diaphorina citri]|nr:venom dipeptidyl peptidase 4-like [Diaphorina citri]
MILTRALTNANIIYRHQTYTDEGFSFQGVKTHLYETIEAFWEECFGPMDIEEWDEGLSFLTFAQ